MVFFWLLISSLLLSPLYVWRFSLFGIPANFLLIFQLLILAIFAVWVIANKELKNYFLEIKNTNKVLLFAIFIFFSCSVIGLFNNGVTVAKLGQQLVLFTFPIATFFSVKFLTSKYKYNINWLLYLILIFIFTSGLLSIVQYFTLLTLPSLYWGNSAEPKRAISFFAHPNGYGLFVVPLLVFTLPWLYDQFINTKNAWLWVMWLVGVIGILLSLSRGAMLGLISAVGLFVLIKGGKKLWIAFASIMICILLIVAIIPNLRYRVMLPFMGEKSSVARFSLWKTGQKVIVDNPIFGLGVNGFADNWDKYNSDQGLRHYNYPHNIILNFWVDYGLIGIIGFLIIALYGIYFSYKNKNNYLALGLGLFIVSMFVHGLIDIPYLKNDLALEFWILFALGTSFIYKNNQ